MAGEEFAVEMEEEVKEDEDSTPSTDVTSTKAQQVN